MYWIQFLILAILLHSYPVKAQEKAPPAENQEIYKALDIFGDVLERVRTDYYKKPQDLELIYDAIDGMLEKLDPKSEFRRAHNVSEQPSAGIGAELVVLHNKLTVVATLPGSPAQFAAIMPLDVITNVDSRAVEGLPLADSIKLLRGQVNTPVSVTLTRAGHNGPLVKEMVRGLVVNAAVTSSKERGIKYIRIKEFVDGSANEVGSAIKAGLDMGDKLRGFILDLRNCGGGSIEEAVAVADLFIDAGAIKLTRGRDNLTKRTNATPGDKALGRKLIVLINGGTGAAAEIVAAALKDQKRAILLESPTFGSGKVQTIMPFADGSSLKLTTEELFTPTGEPIEGKGVEPNLEIDNISESGLYRDLLTEFPNIVPGGLTEDNQYKAAVEKMDETHLREDYFGKDDKLIYILSKVEGKLETINKYCENLSTDGSIAYKIQYTKYIAKEFDGVEKIWTDNYNKYVRETREVIIKYEINGVDKARTCEDFRKSFMFLDGSEYLLKKN